MKQLSIGLISLGCSKNLADSQVMAGQLLQHGYTLAPSPDDADVILINTCAFIEPARAEAAENILAACAHKAKGACRAVVVAGCLPQRYREQIAEAFPDVDFFLGVDELETLPQRLQALTRKSPLPKVTIAPELPTRLFEKPIQGLRLTGRAFAYLKIAEGCNHACAFCAIPQFRGKLRSRSVEAIVTEARELIATGARELNLIAQDVTAYGQDLHAGVTLSTLLRKLDALEGDFWIRILYGFHNHVTDELLATFASARHLVPYFDLPIQHSDPAILRAMRRADTIAAIQTFPARLRHALPTVTLRTTCMVGFPGETEAQFEALCAYVEKTRFDHLGTFIFSPEEGTAAAVLPDLPAAEVAQRRYETLMQLQRRLARESNRARIGTTARALIIDYDGKDGAFARLPHQAPEVDGVTHLKYLPDSIAPGDFVDVRVTGARGYNLTAQLLHA
ncbi:MAG: 30S ribosomal protein S12 methylthiotransferase RimO [Kiritimatiellia bacterium]